MRRVLVTGANKGIGLAIAKAILEQGADTFVYLGSRDIERGKAARASLMRAQADWEARIEVVLLDVADERSVSAASREVARSLGAEKLYGIVNNAGLGTGNEPAAVVTVNALGVHHVCSAFLPLLEPVGGRIVNVTSAAGPMFVAACSTEMRHFFLDRELSWARLASFVEEVIAMGADPAAFAARGLSDGAPYGLSKALANTITLILAREHPELRVNACTPGFIETDMTRHYAEAQGKAPAELGMKPPAEGVIAPLFLLFGDPPGNGRYYGSDAQRSPLDRYRAPGTPPYTGP